MDEATEARIRELEARVHSLERLVQQLADQRKSDDLQREWGDLQYRSYGGGR